MSVDIGNPKKLIQFTFLYLLAVILGIALWSRNWEIIRLGSAKQVGDLLGILAFWLFCAITLIAYIEIKTQKKLSSEILVLIGLQYFVCLFFVSQVLDINEPSWDYRQYEAAFQAVTKGVNPYLSNRYLYPPVFADMMVLVYRLGLRVFLWLHIGKSEWIFVFYIHQAALLYSLLLSYFLAIEFATRLRIKKLIGIVLVSTIFVFNVPVLRTIAWNQVNFYVLLSILISLLFINKNSFIAGLIAAFGGLIKVYPFALSVPFVLMKNWKAVAGLIVGVLIVVFFETNFFRDFEIWLQFYDFYGSFPLEQELSLFRNSSPMSFFRNTFYLLGISFRYTGIATSVVILMILIWFVIRFYQRSNLTMPQNAQTKDLEYIVATGNLLDFSVISLLIAPTAWEHHYVVAIPLTIWVFAIKGMETPIKVATAFMLIFAMPILDIYLVSYLRLIGIIFLLILASPQNIKQSFDSFQSRNEEIQLLTDH